MAERSTGSFAVFAKKEGPRFYRTSQTDLAAWISWTDQSVTSPRLRAGNRLALGETRAHVDELGVYGHVVLGPREDEWRDFWTAVYDASRRRGVVRVWADEAVKA